MYPLIRKILFTLDPETAHAITLKSLTLLYRLGVTRFFPKPAYSPRQVMGLQFPNPIGLAAGLDKNGDYIDVLATLGAGFIEIGTITPKPQIGNPKPRLFRLPQQQALINYMGFNNKGLQHAIHQLEKMKYRGILAISITKNSNTPLEHAVEDYRLCFQQVAKFASFIVADVSCPNTKDSHHLQQSDFLCKLLTTLKQEQKKIHETQQKYVPLVMKISPDLTQDELQTTADILLQHKIDGIIATNTTTHHDREKGGLSGRPLNERSTKIIAQLHALVQKHIPIIASGGVMDATSAQEKIAAGASLVQVYTGLIYRGPKLLREIAYSTVTDFAKLRG